MLPRRIPALLLGPLVLACGNAGAPTAPDPSQSLPRAAGAIALTDVQHVTLSFSQFVPCAAGGAGETIAWTGDVTLVFHATTLLTRAGDPARLLVRFHFSGTLTGIGETTGNAYAGRYSEHGGSHESDVAGPAADLSSFVLDIQVRDADGRLLGTEWIRAHTTVRDGAIVVDRFSTGFRCRGR